MHRAWARLHQARARLSETRARGRADLTAIREADAALEQALAAEAEVSAAEHREDARREDPAQEPSSAVGPERAEHLNQVRRDEPIRSRLQRQRRDQRGLRRLRPDQAGRSAARRPSQRRRRPRPNCWTTRSPPSNGCSPSGVRCPARRSSVWSAPGTGVPASSAGPWPRPLPTAPHGGSGATPTPPNPRTDPDGAARPCDLRGCRVGERLRYGLDPSEGGNLARGRGPLADSHPAAVALVVCALVPFLMLSAAVFPLAPLISENLGLSMPVLDVMIGLPDAAYAAVPPLVTGWPTAKITPHPGCGAFSAVSGWLTWPPRPWTHPPLSAFRRRPAP